MLMSTTEGVADVGDPVPSADGSALLVPVLETDSTEVDAAPLLEQTAAVQDDHPGLVVAQAGEVTIDDGMTAMMSLTTAFGASSRPKAARVRVHAAALSFSRCRGRDRLRPWRRRSAARSAPRSR